MRIGAFEINEPIPELREPHALATLRPWVDVGNVGSLVLSRLEAHFEAKDLGRLARPGNFFDFTRYRPTIYLEEGQRQLAVPNTYVTYAKRERGNDFLFLHLLEPHMLGETYANSVLRLLERLGVKRYCLIGGMYDMVPHTRQIIVTGGGVGVNAEQDLKEVGVQSSDYQGPTTILYLMTRRAPELGIETMTMIAHLPQYTQLEEDYSGRVRLMEVLSSLYDIPLDEADARKAERQRKHLDALVAENPQMKDIVAQLEAHYDARMARRQEEEKAQLSPEVERFLREMDRRFREN
jgi:predicted ATP-grasp superfamily ATP-dependent carboligase